MDRPNRGPSCDVEPFSLPPARSRSRPRCEGQRRRAAESRLHRLSEGGRGTGRQGARAVGEALGSRRRRDQTGGIPIRPPMLEALSAGGIDYAYCGARRRSSRKRVTRTCSRQRRFPRAVLGRRSSCRKVRRSGLPPISKARRLGSPKAPARVICSSRCESAPSVKPAGFKSFKELPRRSAAGPPPPPIHRSASKAATRRSNSFCVGRLSRSFPFSTRPRRASAIRARTMGSAESIAP